MLLKLFVPKKIKVTGFGKKERPFHKQKGGQYCPPFILGTFQIMHLHFLGYRICMAFTGL